MTNVVKPTHPMFPGFDAFPAGRKEPPEEQPPPVAKEVAPPRHNDLSLYICHEQEAERIFQRKSDGYFDATAMCRAYAKLFGGYRRLDGTQEFLLELASDMQIDISHLVESNRAGPYSTRGTWVHPEVAVDLAKWLSPKFRVKVNRWVLQWMQGRQPAFNGDDVEPFVVGRMMKAFAEEQRRQTVILQRMDRHTTQTMLDLFRSEKEEQSRKLVLGPTKEPESTTSSGRPRLVEPRAPLPRTGTGS